MMWFTIVNAFFLIFDKTSIYARLAFQGLSELRNIVPAKEDPVIDKDWYHDLSVKIGAFCKIVT